MSEPARSTCDRCSVLLSPGASHYWMSLRLTAGFDGYLPEPEPGESTGNLIAACENLNADELEAQVDQEMSFTLCPACRNHIALDPLHRATTKEPTSVH
jgi:hypothetical protein